VSDKQVNGTKVNGSAVPPDVHYTEELPRPKPTPAADDLPPLAPEFWFGDPMPEDALPPVPVAPVPLSPGPVDPGLMVTGPVTPGGLPVQSPPAPLLPMPFDVSPQSTGHPRHAEPIANRLDGLSVAETTSRVPTADGVRHLTEPISRRMADPDAAPTELIPRIDPAIDLEVPTRRVARPAPVPVRALPTRIVPDKAVFPEPKDLVDSDDEDDDEDDDDDDDLPAGRGKHRRPPRKQPLWRELVVLAGVAVLLTFFIQHFVGRVYSIPSGSMEKTLHGCTGCTGDRVFVDKLIYEFRDPSPGDVIVFQGPNTWTEHDAKVQKPDNPLVKGLQYVGSLIGIAPPDERDFVKRVIAVGGQTVECCDDKHRVIVNGKPLDEPYIHWEFGAPDERQRFDRVTVPEGTLWVMGDNRSNSSDSRFQGGGGIRGVVPLGKVIGKARYIVLPPSRWQGVGDHDPQEASGIGAAAWQQGLPAGIGLAAAWPVIWLGRRAKNALTPRKAD
jgi:signal peptidase I